MSQQDRSRPKRAGDESAEEEGEVASIADAEDIDELLDEIDSVLEENAEDFVKNYVQKGGQ